jgi:hypothetical protein
MWGNYAAILWTSPENGYFQFITVGELEGLGLKEQLLEGPINVECSEEELDALIASTPSLEYNPQEILGSAILRGVEILE